MKLNLEAAVSDLLEKFYSTCWIGAYLLFVYRYQESRTTLLDHDHFSAS